MPRARQHHRRKTNWYVITGAPCSGKTTVVSLLKERGYKTTIEDARHYLDLQLANGKSVEEIERHQRSFQLHVLNMQIAQERSLEPEQIVFLDRAIPDARAYYRHLMLPEDQKLAAAIANVSYKKIFILDFLPLVNDYARRENSGAQRRIHQALVDVYETLPFPIVHVPVMEPEKRVAFILENL
jgi:predicted ATPase